MDYEKMKALMEAGREQSSAAQRERKVKEFREPEPRPDWNYLGELLKERKAA